MTTLRIFQNEIEDIHNRELSKRRAQSLTDVEKEQKPSKGKAKMEPYITASSLTGENGTDAVGFQEMEELISVCRKLPMCKSQLLIILFRFYFSLQIQGIMIVPVTKWQHFLPRIMGNMCCALDNSPLMRNCLRVISRTNLLDGLERLGPSKRLILFGVK